MRFLPQLFANNRAWAQRAMERDPEFFAREVARQDPEYLWIGCADSRVPANEIIGLNPGELFVHRNVANLVEPDDINCGAVLQYAVDVLHVRHIIVCGHYRCGGVQAALGDRLESPIEDWLVPLRDLVRQYRDTLDAIGNADRRWDRLCELNVVAQVGTVRDHPLVRAAWQRGQELVVHGWIYDLRSGLLSDLDVSASAPPD